MNRTQISNAVTAVFTLGKQADINMVPATYEFGSDAAQDLKVVSSALWTVRNEIVKNVGARLDNKPIFDQPMEGSLEANDTGRGDEMAEERERALKSLVREEAILVRRIKQLVEIALDHVERVMPDDRMAQYKQKVFISSYNKPFAVWLIERKAVATGTWLDKLNATQEWLEDECIEPVIDAQTAKEEWEALVSDEYTTKSALRAWQQLVDKLEGYGQIIKAHNTKMAQLTDKTEMARESSEYRSLMNSAEFVINKMLENNIDLLKHAGAPKYLVDSPEWRTEIAKIRAGEAQAAAQEALAATAESEAMILQTQANMALFQARQLQMQMELKLKDQMAQMEAMFALHKPTPQPAVEPVAPSPVLPKPQPKGRAPRSLKGRNGAAGFEPSMH